MGWMFIRLSLEGGLAKVNTLIIKFKHHSAFRPRLFIFSHQNEVLIKWHQCECISFPANASAAQCSFYFIEHASHPLPKGLRTSCSARRRFD